MVVSNVGIGLTELFSNFFERKPFKKMQPQRLPLLLAQYFLNPSPAISPEEPFDGPVVVCTGRRPVFNFSLGVRNAGRLEPVGL